MELVNFRNAASRVCGIAPRMLGETIQTSVTPILARFRSGIAYSLAGSVAGQGAAFSVGLILANLLGKESFGEYSMIISTILTVSLIGQLGSGYAASKYIAELRSVNTIRAGRVLSLLATVSRVAAILSSGLFFVGADALAEAVFLREALTGTRWAGSAAVLFATMNGFTLGALAGFEAYRATAVVMAVSGIANVVLSVLFAFRWGVTGAVLALALSNAIQWYFSRAAVRRLCVANGISVSAKDAMAERQVITRFALPGALSGVTSMPAMWLANVSLAVGPGGFERLGIYSAALLVMRFVGFLPGVVNTVGMALVNYYRGTNEAERYKAAFLINLFITIVSSLAVGVVLGLFGRQVLGLFGEGYEEGATTLLILLAAGIVDSAVLALNQVVQSKERMWLAIGAINIPRDGVLIGLAFVLAPLLGHQGVALGFLVSRIVALGSMLIVVKHVGLGMFHLTSAKKE